MNAITPFDPVSEYFVANPYSEYIRMREQCPVYRHETRTPIVSVFKDRDIRAVVADHQTFSSELSAETNDVGRGILTPLLGEDPPGHTAHRQIVAPFFLPGRVQQMLGQIDLLVTEMMDEALEKEEIDFIEEFAGKITVGVIGTLCGVPKEHWPFVRKVTVDLARDYGKAQFCKEPQPDIEAGVANYGKLMGEFFGEHVKYLRRTDTPSILTDIGKSVKDDATFAALGANILSAANESTANLMTNNLYELVHHPAEFAKLRANPELLPSAVEEFLRYRPTFRIHERRATRDTEIGGIAVHENDAIVLWGASACRDPEAIDRPEEFDISRQPNRHHALGSGIHMCIGNALARAETRLVYQQILNRTSAVEETRGDDSYESWRNGLLDAAKRYSVRLVPK